MRKNVGTIDFIVRLIIGVVIAVLGVVFKSWLGLIAIIPIGTALIHWCPLYRIFGISTCKVEETTSES